MYNATWPHSSRFSLLWDGGAPPLSRKFAHPPLPRKIFPSGLPHQIFIPSQATQLLPPLNNNFQVTHNKNSIFLAVDIAPVPFLF